EKGMPNTVTLSTGDVVYDLNGEWDSISDLKHFGISRKKVKITQEGNKFVSVSLTYSTYIDKGREIQKGELEKDGFKSLYTFTLPHGWVVSKGKISDGGNKIIVETPIEVHGITAITTLTRK
ncbi:MAG: hypothetical protein JSV31_30750, partial [Desulfobacterales bacterium]